MITRRINYLLVWIGCLIFFWAYRQWISWFTLAIVTILPLFSLLISLPAILSAKLRFQVPDSVTIGTPCTLRVQARTILPPPCLEYSMELTRSLNVQHQKIENGSPLPTEHCGILSVKIKKPRIYDYLGLFRFPVRIPPAHTLIVRPVPVTPKTLPNPEYISGHVKQINNLVDSSEPKPYYPGDIIQQIHWKLSAKTGNLILNKPVGTDQSRILLRLTLAGTEEELDQKLGNLLWLGTRLLEKNIPYDIECLAAGDYENWCVSAHDALLCVIDIILSRECGTSSQAWEQCASGSLQYDIGGEIIEI